MRPVSFKLRPIKRILRRKEAVCVVEIFDKNDTRLTVCAVKTPMEDNGEFVMIEKKKINRNKNKVAHTCPRNYTDYPPTSCHNSMWELVYTNLQLEGEALLMIMLDVKNKVYKDYFITNVYNLAATYRLNYTQLFL